MQQKSKSHTNKHVDHATVHDRIELDTHADMTVVGSNCIVVGYNGKECEVSPYADEYSPIQNVLVVTEATAWTNPQDGTSIILVFNEALWMGDRLDHTLVNPNQMRAYGIDMQDNPV